MWTTPTGNERDSSENYVEEIRRRPADFRVLEKVPLEFSPKRFSAKSAHDRVLTILDTETTGFDDGEDRIIELAMVRCRYNPGGLVEVEDVYDALEDPGFPIPQEVTDVTGITDEMVAGHSIDENQVERWLGRDPLVVAHNAAFDRPFFERRFPQLGGYRWACSMVGIPWKDMGYGTQSQPLLAMQEGWFYDAHRASNDCLALAWLLHSVGDALESLHGSTADSYTVSAAGRGTYDARHTFKERGYRWDGISKKWSKEVDAPSLQAEKRFLNSLNDVYAESSGKKITARNRFKR